MKIKTVFLGNNKYQFQVLLEMTDVKALFIRSNHSSPTVKETIALAEKNNIPVHCPKSMKPEKDSFALDIIKKIRPDLIVSGGYHLVVPEEIINYPKYGTVNIHPALLPKYRGQHVIQWQIINNEKITGATLHYMAKDLDKGDLISQSKCPLNPEDTAQDVWKNTSLLGAELLEEAVSVIEETGKLKGQKQDDSAASYFNARKPEEGFIDWNKSPQEIQNLVRALVYPWPGASFKSKNKTYIVDRVGQEKGNPGNGPGFITSNNGNEMKVCASNGCITIRKDNLRDYEGDFSEFVAGSKLD